MTRGINLPNQSLVKILDGINTEQVVLELLKPVIKTRVANPIKIINISNKKYSVVDEDGTVTEFTINSVIESNILYGRYSKIPDHYILNNFSGTTHRVLYDIVWKYTYIRSYWETKIGIKFDSEQEVWSKLPDEYYI